MGDKSNVSKKAGLGSNTVTMTIKPEESIKWAKENQKLPTEVVYRDKVSMSLLFLALGTAGMMFLASRRTDGHST